MKQVGQEVNDNLRGVRDMLRATTVQLGERIDTQEAELIGVITNQGKSFADVTETTGKDLAQRLVHLNETLNEQTVRTEESREALTTSVAALGKELLVEMQEHAEVHSTRQNDQLQFSTEIREKVSKIAGSLFVCGVPPPPPSPS